VPAAAVIPAPEAYIYIAAFKKLVVEASDAAGRTAELVALVPPSQARRASVACTLPCERGAAARSP
jgi:hypothetical protein